VEQDLVNWCLFCV